jgi:hypothetical protein
MADYNPSSMDSNREIDKEEGRRREDEEGKRRTTSDEQAGDIFVFSPARRRSHDNSNRRSRIDRPEQFDILCGRGKPTQNHPGNVILHQIVDEHCERYHSAPRLLKRGIADEIVQAIKKSRCQHYEQQQPGRFIMREQEGNGGVYWKEISDDAARDKVSHCFRARRRHLMMIEEKTSTSSQLPAAGAVAVAIPPALSTASDNREVLGRSFALMNDMELSPYPYLQQQQQQQQQQHHQSQTTSQLPQRAQSSLQMVAYYYACHGVPLLGVGLAGPPPHGTTRDPAPATPPPQQEEKKQQGPHHGQQSMGSDDQQETQQSAAPAEDQASARHNMNQEQGPPSQDGGRENKSKAN